MADLNDIQTNLDIALFDRDPVARDRAQLILSERVDKLWLHRAVCALDAPRDLTRRRALRLLSSLPPARTHKLFKARIIDQTISTRIRVGLARILTATSDGIVTELATTIKAPDVRLRRASATASTPTDALLDALFDEDPEVLSRAAEVLLKREHPIPIGTVQTLVDHVSEVTDMFVRLVAFSNPPPELLERFGVRGLDALKTYMTSPEWLREAFRDQPDRLAWKLGQSGVVDPLWATEGTPSQRAACARYLDSDHNILEHLASDPEPAVAWHAQRNLNGRYRTDQLRLRLDNNPIQDSPSASAPYGLRPTDVIDPTVRVEAALALCQARFNMNLGVAMRSAEAAGLGQIVFVGRRDYMRSPARGADFAIPVTALPDVAGLVDFARSHGYQIVAIQQSAGSVPYHQANYPPKPLFVVGSEDAGMQTALRLAADLMVEIPQYGLIDSLNVATAATVVLFHWRVHAPSPL
ncbi:MAG: TrmH family RNA methyltransferase [Bradymonadia bacterium]